MCPLVACLWSPDWPVCTKKHIKWLIDWLIQWSSFSCSDSPAVCWDSHVCPRWTSVMGALFPLWQRTQACSGKCSTIRDSQSEVHPRKYTPVSTPLFFVFLPVTVAVAAHSQEHFAFGGTETNNHSSSNYPPSPTKWGETQLLSKINMPPCMAWKTNSVIREDGKKEGKTTAGRAARREKGRWGGEEIRTNAIPWQESWEKKRIAITLA